MTGRELMEALSAMSSSVLERQVVVMVAKTAYDHIESCEEEDEGDGTAAWPVSWPVIRLERAK